MDVSDHLPPPGSDSKARWWGAAAGLLLAVVDILTMSWLGVSFEMNGRAVDSLVMIWFGSSFAVLGYLIGYLIESRRRERRSAQIIREQIEAIQQTRNRLAQVEKLASLGQLATAIAHEVRNPLAVIRSAAQGLAEGASRDDPETRRASSFITAEIDRLTSVISSLLAFARPPRVERRGVAVAELFDRVELLAADELRDSGLRLNRSVDGPALAVDVDPDLLCQVLLDLVGNSCDAVAAGGTVTLTACAAGDCAEILVADDGPGIAVEIRERIFDPFFTTRARGVGLGLAVARQILAAHDGRIEAGERPGGGARFTLRLPLARGKALAA